MRASLLAVVAATDARTINDNTAFAEALARVLATSEADRVNLAETVWENGLQARERGEEEEAAKLFEAAIDGRGKGLCDDIKAGRDRVVDMRRELLALHVGVGGAAGGVWELLGGFLGRCACCSLLAPSLIEDNDYKEKVAKGKYELASDLHARGDYDDALALYEEALVLYTEACGHNSLSVARTYCNIANVYNSQGKHDLALEYYQKDLEITVRVVGHDHPLVADTLLNTAAVYLKQGKYDEALDLYQKAEKVYAAVATCTRTWPLLYATLLTSIRIRASMMRP
jgi:tetratricopeptide (TPR) repeat protein